MALWALCQIQDNRYKDKVTLPQSSSTAEQHSAELIGSLPPAGASTPLAIGARLLRHAGSVARSLERST